MYSERQQRRRDEDDNDEDAPPSTTANSAVNNNGNSTRTLKNIGNNNSKSQNRIGFPRKKYASSYDMKQRLEDPFRFTGDGIDFKSKFIGEQDVVDARGDRMCQNAMQSCKARAKRRGEHKQRIWFNVSLKGFKIKDQMTGVILHTFPVNKVSFIAKDITDGRAFGFVYGGPDEKHKFFAIKTEKSANIVVFSIRDMFQIVYEIKKKQIEEAKLQQLMQQQNVLNKLQADAVEVANGHHGRRQNEHDLMMECTTEYTGGEPAVGHLLDLEMELENLEQDIQNINDWAAFSDENSQHLINIQMMHSVSAPNGYSINDHVQAKIASESNGFVQPAIQRPRPTFQLKANEDIIAHLPPPTAVQSSRKNHTITTSQSSPNGDLFGSSIASNFGEIQQPANGSSKPLPVGSVAVDPFDTSHVTQILKENRSLNNAPSQYALFHADEILSTNNSNDANLTQRSLQFDLLTPVALNSSSLETDFSTTPMDNQSGDYRNSSTANGNQSTGATNLNKNAFDKLCNLDALSNSSTQKLQTIGVITTTTAAGAKPGMEKSGSKKSLNEMRDEKNPVPKATPNQQQHTSLNYDLLLQPMTKVETERPISIDVFNDLATIEGRNATPSFSPVPPIPPRAIGGASTAVLPRPGVVGQRQAKGLLPPPLTTTSRKPTTTEGSAKSSDPFADDFFS